MRVTLQGYADKLFREREREFATWQFDQCVSQQVENLQAPEQASKSIHNKVVNKNSVNLTSPFWITIIAAQKNGKKKMQDKTTIMDSRIKKIFRYDLEDLHPQGHHMFLSDFILVGSLLI